MQIAEMRMIDNFLMGPLLPLELFDPCILSRGVKRTTDNAYFGKLKPVRSAFDELIDDDKRGGEQCQARSHT